MNISPEALEAFAYTTSTGSFSAAARRLGKSQSTISEAIARLEIDLGVELFVRHTRKLTLTEAGQGLLGHAHEILDAMERLARHAGHLSAGQEAKLTLALSDAYQQGQYEARLTELNERFPDLEFECLIAERADVLDLVSQGRAQLGLLTAHVHYAADIAHARLTHTTEFGVFVACNHVLTQPETVKPHDLGRWRALRLSSVAIIDEPNDDPLPSGHQCWSAPDYLLLLEMAALGFGWAVLPRPLVDAYGHRRLKELSLPGWPRQVSVDLVWSRLRPLGPVATWLQGRMTMN